MFCKVCGYKINGTSKFCIKCGSEVESPQIKKRGSFFRKKRFILVGITLFIFIVIYLFFYFQNRNQASDQRDQDIASTVVNIYCEGASGKDEDSRGGSGTIITSSGIVLTNAHIIPQGKDESANEKSCIVILPDPTTGAAKEMYYAKPLVIPEISEKYDIAFIQIDDVYYDKEEGRAYGEYPRIFPAYDSSRYCKNENVKLGEPVRIYGYPAISGGYALTITDGVVSSLLLDEGLIVTSAKISHGNSGGLAVDKNGCRIGVPSMVNSDENESLGIIISMDLINKFNDEVQVYIDSLE